MLICYLMSFLLDVLHCLATRWWQDTTYRNLNAWISFPVSTSKIVFTGNFIRDALLVPGWTPFCFQNCLILRGLDSAVCKQSSDILVYIDMVASPGP